VAADLVVVANIMAMLFQALSAKLGIVTRRHLAELGRLLNLLLVLQIAGIPLPAFAAVG
jgi:Mn2+/Fe2+ NRAMP family transporter